MLSKKQYVLIIIGVVVVVALAMLLPKAESPQSGNVGQQPGSSVAVTPTPAPVVTVKSGAPKPSTNEMPLTYAQAIQRYGGYRFQFDMYCQMNPGHVSLKNGATIMLDNRSGDPRTIKVGPTAYSLAGYGWRIVQVAVKTFPTTLMIDCGAGRNVGSITVNK
jgi:hypothetical protein